MLTMVVLHGLVIYVLKNKFLKRFQNFREYPEIIIFGGRGKLGRNIALPFTKEIVQDKYKT